MSHLTLSMVSTTASQVAGEFVFHIKTLAKVIANRRSVHKLHACDDRMLKDIGLVRSDVIAALDMPMNADPSSHLRRVAAGRCRTR